MSWGLASDLGLLLACCLLACTSNSFLDRANARQNEHVMGIRGVENDDFEATITRGLGSEFSCFLRPS